MAVDEGLPEISVVGASLRLPGSPDVDAFWQLLSEGRSAISRVTPDRWPVERYYHPKRTMRGRSYSAVAGLIEGLWDFDPDLFGISPREAAQMDPQQRLTLMVAWEALEAAGLPPTRLPRERTGVYVGASGTEHGSYFYADLSRSDAQGMTGSTLSIISNRLSHIFDLQGPSYTVDTACSSSLFALDHAVTALQRRDVDVAIVAGVNVCLAALAFIGFSAANMLSARGQIHAFDARADGYVRGEGAVALVLKRQEEAARDGDPELAVIGATGTMSTGLGSGLTRPSAARQASLIGAVARRLPSPEALGFVEAHGTGTPVGDPEEALAIGQTLAQGRQTPLPFGSVKTNIGHLEPASGLAGLMKAILALRHGILPPSLNFETPNPAIDFEALNVAVATAPTPLSLLADGAPLHALVNSFGFGGANASVLLRASTRTPEADAGAASGCEPEALLLSAASEASLQRQIEAWRTRLENADTAETARLVTTANHRRARLGHRVVALRPAGGRLVEGLRRDAELVTGRSRVGRTGLAVETGTAFVFSGNGSQYLGMGAHLYEEDPVYKETFDAVAELFRAEDPAQDIHAWLADPALETHMGMATRAQPMLFALQAGLVATLEHHGLRPDATAGHSIGEACAAWAAGAIPLEQAVQIIASRAPLLQALHGTGTMAAALCDAATIAEIIEEEALTGVYLSGENSPRSSTISGTVEGIGLFERAAKRRRVAVRRLDIAYPYHSPACDPLHDAFMQALNRLTPQETPVLYASSTEGALLPGDRLDIGYWWRNIREPVRFRPAVAALRDAGMGVFIEIGPRPVLKSYVTD
ncbi:MAG: type I polyketide synthase, partial [Pseudomonadota bacterium]